LNVSKDTYTLIPCPIPRHEVRIPLLAVHKLAVWDIVEAVSQVGISENVVNDHSRVAVPELILGGHPLRCGPVVRSETIILSGV
jgi:hypothetical protein